MSLKTTHALAVLLLTGTLASANPLVEASESVYKLYQKETPVCSAVAISKTQLVTAAHCIPENRETPLSIRSSELNDKFEETSRTAHFLDLLRTLKDEDVALLEIKASSIELKPLPVCDEDSLTFGDRLYAIGFPNGGNKTVTEGLYTDFVPLSSLNLKGGFYKTTIPVTGGNSGGALMKYDTDRYCLLGLTTAARQDISFMSYFSNLDTLRRVYNGLLSDTLPDHKTGSAKGKPEEVAPIENGIDSK